MDYCQYLLVSQINWVSSPGELHPSNVTQMPVIYAVVIFHRLAIYVLNLNNSDGDRDQQDPNRQHQNIPSVMVMTM